MNFFGIPWVFASVPNCPYTLELRTVGTFPRSISLQGSACVNGKVQYTEADWMVWFLDARRKRHLLIHFWKVGWEVFFTFSWEVQAQKHHETQELWGSSGVEISGRKVVWDLEVRNLCHVQENCLLSRIAEFVPTNSLLFVGSRDHGSHRLGLTLSHRIGVSEQCWLISSVNKGFSWGWLFLWAKSEGGWRRRWFCEVGWCKAHKHVWEVEMSASSWVFADRARKATWPTGVAGAWAVGKGMNRTKKTNIKEYFAVLSSNHVYKPLVDSSFHVCRARPVGPAVRLQQIWRMTMARRKRGPQNALVHIYIVLSCLVLFVFSFFGTDLRQIIYKKWEAKMRSVTLRTS